MNIKLILIRAIIFIFIFSPIVNAQEMDFSSQNSTVKTYLHLWKSGQYKKMIEAFSDPMFIDNENISSLITRAALLKKENISKGYIKHPYEAPVSYKIISEYTCNKDNIFMYCKHDYVKDQHVKIIRVLIKWGWMPNFKNENEWIKKEWKEHHKYYLRNTSHGWKIVILEVEQWNR